MGNPDAVDDEILKLGVVGVLRMQQIERRNIMRFIKAIGATLAGVILWIVQRTFRMP